MAFTQKRLAGPTQLGATTAVLYTVPQNTTTIVKQIILTNTSASQRTATIRLKPANVSEASTHDIVSALTLSPNESLFFNLSLVLNNNGGAAGATTSDQICAFASTASSVNITIFGIEES